MADFFGGLAHGSVIFWCVAAGPYVLVMLVRLLYAIFALIPVVPMQDDPPQRRRTAPKQTGNLQRGRIEPHM